MSKKIRISINSENPESPLAALKVVQIALENGMYDDVDVDIVQTYSIPDIDAIEVSQDEGEIKGNSKIILKESAESFRNTSQSWEWQTIAKTMIDCHDGIRTVIKGMQEKDFIANVSVFIDLIKNFL